MRLRTVTPEDHPHLHALWSRTPGIQLRNEDELAPFVSYLERNPGLSVLVEVEGAIVGCLLAGHDGRRGYLQHLVVDASFRNRGLARAMIDEVLSRLAGLGIRKSHVFVLRDAPEALSFWASRHGWSRRDDIQVYSNGG